MTAAVQPLIKLLMDERDGEAARHQHEAPSTEVWEAQADQFSSHLVRRILALVADEIKLALGDTICLHKALYAFTTAAEQTRVASTMAAMALVQLEDMDSEPDDA